MRKTKQHDTGGVTLQSRSALLHGLFWLSAWTSLLGCAPPEAELDSVNPGHPVGIVGGEETNYASWQGVVGLIDTSVGSLCTGTLIDPEIVLTAAHCLAAAHDPRKIVVLGGANMDIYYTEGADWAFNPEFDASTMIGDMALLMLARPIHEVECYPVRGDATPEIGEEGWLVGYGLASSSDPTSSRVHRKGQAQILTVSWDETQLEIGDPSVACQGDSGGPFFTEQSGKWVATGITSYGTHLECDSVRDSWSTNVFRWRDWMDANAKEYTGHTLSSTDCPSKGGKDTTSDNGDDTDTETLGDAGDDNNGENTGSGAEFPVGGSNITGGSPPNDDNCSCSLPGRQAALFTWNWSMLFGG